MEVKGKPFPETHAEGEVQYIVHCAREYRSKGSLSVDSIIELRLENLRLRKQLEESLLARGADPRLHPLLKGGDGLHAEVGPVLHPLDLDEQGNLDTMTLGAEDGEFGVVGVGGFGGVGGVGGFGGGGGGGVGDDDGDEGLDGGGGGFGGFGMVAGGGVGVGGSGLGIKRKSMGDGGGVEGGGGGGGGGVAQGLAALTNAAAAMDSMGGSSSGGVGGESLANGAASGSTNGSVDPHVTSVAEALIADMGKPAKRKVSIKEYPHTPFTVFLFFLFKNFFFFFFFF
jgi:hypothetical protein